MDAITKFRCYSTDFRTLLQTENDSIVCKYFLSSPLKNWMWRRPNRRANEINPTSRSGNQEKENRRHIDSRFRDVGMNRDFVYNIHDDRPSLWTRTGNTLNKWLWGAFCCGAPGVPCYFCTCCVRVEHSSDSERSRVHQSTGTAVERISRPHRPHAPGGRKSTPEMLSAVRCALSQLQGEPAPPLPPKDSQTGKVKPDNKAVDPQ